MVEEKSRIGDWEVILLLAVKKNTGIITRAERRSRYLLGDLFKKKSSVFIKEKIVKSFTKIGDNKNILSDLRGSLGAKS